MCLAQYKMSSSLHKWEIESDTLWNLFWLMIIASLGSEGGLSSCLLWQEDIHQDHLKLYQVGHMEFKEWIMNIILIPWDKLLLILKSILLESYLVRYWEHYLDYLYWIYFLWSYALELKLLCFWKFVKVRNTIMMTVIWLLEFASMYYYFYFKTHIITKTPLKESWPVFL